MKSESLAQALLSSGSLHQCPDPVDLLFVEHHRQRSALARISRTIEQDRVDVAAVVAVLGPLAADAAVHCADEEDSLFPLLYQRKRREDAIDPLISKLLSEHKIISAAAAMVTLQLNGCDCRGHAELPPAVRAEMLRLVFLVEGHLALENGVMLPIAHQRLTLCDRIAIGRDFKSRRRNAIGSMACPSLTLSASSLLHH